jgi:hypothetical protein
MYIASFFFFLKLHTFSITSSTFVQSILLFFFLFCSLPRTVLQDISFVYVLSEVSLLKRIPSLLICICIGGLPSLVWRHRLSAWGVLDGVGWTVSLVGAGGWNGHASIFVCGSMYIRLVLNPVNPNTIYFNCSCLRIANVSRVHY